MSPVTIFPRIIFEILFYDDVCSVNIFNISHTNVLSSLDHFYPFSFYFYKYSFFMYNIFSDIFYGLLNRDNVFIL